MVTHTMAREVLKGENCYTFINYKIHITMKRNL